MRHIPNILFSTTRMWNCGDDFILFGVRNLVEQVIGPFNAVVYNRNPELHYARTQMDVAQDVRIGGVDLTVNPYQVIRNCTGKFDNSWRGQDLDKIDYVIFSGTPEWDSLMVQPLVDQLIEQACPVAYLGIGAFEKTGNRKYNELGAHDRILLERARLVTVRDHLCGVMLEPVNPVRLPCPALFSSSSQTARRPGKKLRIALSTQGSSPQNFQRVERDVLEYTVRLFRALAGTGRFECELVCHYIDELWELESLLGDLMPLRYSYDAADYSGIYDRFDLTVTTRVHGAGLCASLGVPGFVVAHSTRSDTADGFLAELIPSNEQSIDPLVDQIAGFDVVGASERLIEHKTAVREQYLQLLGQFFDR